MLQLRLIWWILKILHDVEVNERMAVDDAGANNPPEGVVLKPAFSPRPETFDDQLEGDAPNHWGQSNRPVFTRSVLIDQANPATFPRAGTSPVWRMWVHKLARACHHIDGRSSSSSAFHLSKPAARPPIVCQNYGTAHRRQTHRQRKRPLDGALG